jgi:hypothetical protein
LVAKGDIVLIKSYEEFFGEKAPEGLGWEEHLFLVDEVFDDLVTGHSIVEELKDVYGEPELGLIKKVYREVIG